MVRTVDTLPFLVSRRVSPVDFFSSPFEIFSIVAFIVFVTVIAVHIITEKAVYWNVDGDECSERRYNQDYYGVFTHI